MFAPWKKNYDQPGQCIKKQRHYFANKGPSSQSYLLSSHVWMWELDDKESWLLKNWSFWTVVLEKTLESPLDTKDIQPVHPKGDQSWIFIGRLILKLKLQYSGHLMQRTDSWKRPWCLEWLKAGDGAKRLWDGWMASPTQWVWGWVNSRSLGWTGKTDMLQSMGSQSGIWLGNRTRNMVKPRL